jgi:hypothetical protein
VFVKEGTIKFGVCLRLYSEDQITIQKEFNTTIATGPVLQGLEVESTEDPEQYSILANMKTLRSSAANYATEAALSADEAAATNRDIKSFMSPPTANGTYVLKVTVTGGTPTYHWDSE